MISAAQSLQDKEQQTAATERRPEKVLAAWAVDPKHRGSVPEKLSRATTVTPCRERWRRLKHPSLCTLQDWAEENFTSKVSEIAAVLSSHKPARSSLWILPTEKPRQQGANVLDPHLTTDFLPGGTNPYTLMHAVDFPSSTPADHWIQFRWNEAN